jgi:hypothetical protein
MADKPVPQGPPVTFIDNPHAPEVFASDCCGFFRLEGNVVMAFESARVDHVTTPGPVNRVVIGRIVMPIGAAQRLALQLYDFLKNQGLDPGGSIKTEGDPSRPQ